MVLLRVFKNNMGKMCLDEAMATPDACQVFSKHERLQETNHREQCASGALLRELTNFHLEDHNGTRMSFLTEWFNKHHQLNKLVGGICRHLQWGACGSAVA